MAVIDLRDKSKVGQNGSSMIDLGLTALQAQAAFGDTMAVAGWYRIGYQAGGDIGRDTDAQRVRDESTVTIAQTGTTNDFTISNTLQQTDSKTLDLMEYWDTHDLPVRYFLPLPDPTMVQVRYHPAMSKDEGPDRISTSAGVRTMQWTARGDRARLVRADVAVVQTGWPAKLAGAKDTAIV